MYRGLEVGELSKLTLNPGKVTGEMTVDPSVVPLMRENTRIELRNPKLSLSDANISSLLTGKPSNWCRATANRAVNLWWCRVKKPCCMRRMP